MKKIQWHPTFEVGRLTLMIVAITIGWIIAMPAYGADANPAVVPTKRPGPLTPEEEIDREHLRQIYQAIQAFRRDHAGDYPDWLSDLFPAYLMDTNVLLSPVELRTGRSNLYGYDDPKLHTSYIYELNAKPTSTYHVPDPAVAPTMKRWKLLQTQRFGQAVPMVRCLLHEQALNLAISGDIYRTGLFWETDPETRALMSRLGAESEERGPRHDLTIEVVDHLSGQPIPEARVGVEHLIETGYQPFQEGLTDPQGEIRVTLSGEQIRTVRVVVQGEDHVAGAVEWQRMGDQQETPERLRVRLVRSISIGGRVQSANGQPLAGVLVRVDQLSALSQALAAGTSTPPSPVLETRSDGDGRWSLRGIPQDFGYLGLSAACDGYRPGRFSTAGTDAARNPTSVARFKAGEVVLTLWPQVTVRLQVHSLGSDRPVDAFTVIPARSVGRTLQWDTANMRRGEGGALLWGTATESDRFPRFFRVEAQGFAPAIIEQLHEPAANRTHSVALRPLKPVSGAVWDAEGKPAAAQIALIPELATATLAGAEVRPGEGVLMTSARDGRFELSLPAWAGRIVAVGTSGFAEGGAGDLDLKLVPWATLHGSVPMVGSSEGMMPVVLLSRGPHLPRLFEQPAAGWLTLDTDGYLAEADREGHWQLDHVPAGRWVRWHPVLIDPARPPIASMMCFNGRWVDASPGQVTQVDVRGASVRAQIALALVAPVADWSACLGAMRLTPRGGAGPVQEHLLTFSRLGELHLQGIPAGDYDVELRAFSAPRLLGAGRTELHVPEAAASPVQLGVIRLHPPRAGQLKRPAPELESKILRVGPASTILTTGKEVFRLAHHSGRYVLLHFWTSWCGARLASHPYLVEVANRYAATDRLMIVGVNLDEAPYGVEEGVSQRTSPWMETQGESWLEGRVAADFGVTAFPSLALVDPEGRLVVADLAPEELDGVLRDVLGEVQPRAVSNSASIRVPILAESEGE